MKRQVLKFRLGTYIIPYRASLVNMSIFYLPIIFSQTIFEAPDANSEKYIISLERIMLMIICMM